MKTVNNNDIPACYPISPPLPGSLQTMELLDHLKENPPNEAINFSEHGFSPHFQVEWRERRQAVISGLTRRGYRVDERVLTQKEFELGAGMGYEKEGWLEDKRGVFGIPYSLQWGNMEGPHGIFFVESIQRAQQRSISRVLDIGCGPTGFQKINVEGLGINEVIYGDNSERYLQSLQAYLERFGKNEVTREFRIVDKNNPKLVGANFEERSVGLLIRNGVGRFSSGETEGLKHFMALDGEVFVSNSIEGQAIEESLDHLETVFENVQVHVGYMRYALVCSGIKV